MHGDDCNRRTALRGTAAGVVATAGLAGCLGGASSGENGTDENGDNASNDNASTNGSAAGGSGDRKLRVVLSEWQVKPDATSVPAGKITFDAVNEGHEVHELVVRQRNDDGAYEELDEVDDIAKGTSKKLQTKLEPGTYELACLIVEKEDGETEDHYKRGMHETIEVTE